MEKQLSSSGASRNKLAQDPSSHLPAEREVPTALRSSRERVLRQVQVSGVLS